jgi:hypothetical protein
MPELFIISTERFKINVETKKLYKDNFPIQHGKGNSFVRFSKTEPKITLSRACAGKRAYTHTYTYTHTAYKIITVLLLGLRFGCHL